MPMNNTSGLKSLIASTMLSIWSGEKSSQNGGEYPPKVTDLKS